MLAIRWHDKREVDMLSTLHTGKMKRTQKVDWTTGEVVKKPDMNTDYTNNMRLVDKSDMMIGNMETIRKSYTWYKKLFFHMMDMAILNAYNMYLVKTGNHPTLKDFMHDLVFQLLEKYAAPQPDIRKYVALANPPDRLKYREGISLHHPVKMTLDHFVAKRKTASRRCVVCAHSNLKPRTTKSTGFWCPTCKVPLCVEPCFRDYHCLVKY